MFHAKIKHHISTHSRCGMSITDDKSEVPGREIAVLEFLPFVYA